MTALKVLNELKSLSNADHLEGMQRYGIATDQALGIRLPILRNLQKQYKHLPNRHEMALQLWDSNIHEAQILAGMIDDPKQVSIHQMDKWVASLKSWDTCDQVCSNLFQKTSFFLDKAFEYSYNESAFIKRTGFVLMVQYVVHHKKANDELCKQFLKRIEEEAWDERNFVKKAINWCLRQIGKRNQYLYPFAIQTAKKLLQQPHSSAHWIAKDALRELQEKMAKGLIKE